MAVVKPRRVQALAAYEQAVSWWLPRRAGWRQRIEMHGCAMHGTGMVGQPKLAAAASWAWQLTGSQPSTRAGRAAKGMNCRNKRCARVCSGRQRQLLLQRPWLVDDVRTSDLEPLRDRQGTTLPVWHHCL